MGGHRDTGPQTHGGGSAVREGYRGGHRDMGPHSEGQRRKGGGIGGGHRDTGPYSGGGTAQ